ncbi:MAG: mechanosensitive ion channel family protein [Acidimicrobiales bacterium]|nr:mechanosensitive ion channel family protein [Hyphomonadaceae bacterium]RZV44324.1 MAG: mechanosensitive ion channel family protein [Acidimicrobiales bacterium]
MDGLAETTQTYWDKYSNLALENIIVFAPKIILALFLLWIGSAIAGRFYKILLKRTTDSKKIDTTIGSVTASLVKYAILIATILAAVSVLGVEIAKIFTVLAAMTLAVGLALQGTMSNVAAGILLMVFRPYKVGDYVEVNGVEGIVDDINIFTTVLRTLDNVKLTLANGDAWRSTIKNFTSQEFRRVDVDFGIDYDDDMDKAIKIIKDTAAKHEHVLRTPDAPWAKVSNLGESSVDIQMRVWCKPEHYWDVMFDLTKSVKEAFDKGGISIPYPHAVEIMGK